MAGDHGTSANSSSFAESSWRLKELTVGAVTVGVRLLLKRTTFFEVPRTLQNFKNMTSQAWPH